MNGVHVLAGLDGLAGGVVDALLDVIGRDLAGPASEHTINIKLGALVVVPQHFHLLDDSLWRIDFAEEPDVRRSPRGIDRRTGRAVSAEAGLAGFPRGIV